MYERAKYYRNKFIRNGIAGLVFCAFLIFTTKHEVIIDPGGATKDFLQPLIIFSIAALLWLYFGLRIYMKLKTKVASTETEITDERISFKQVEFILTLLFMSVIFLGIRHWKYTDYLAIPVLIGYGWWMYSQMKLVNNYLKG